MISASLMLFNNMQSIVTGRRSGRTILPWLLLLLLSLISLPLEVAARTEVISSPCVLEVVSYLSIIEPKDTPEDQIRCRFSVPSKKQELSGLSYAIEGSPDQMIEIRHRIRENRAHLLNDHVDKELLLDVTSGVFFVVDDEGTEDPKLVLPEGQPIDVYLQDKDTDQRKLAKMVGENSVLIVKVIDGNGVAHPDSPAMISDNFFGTYGDQVTVKSQMEACSMGRLKIQPGSIPDDHELAPGVIEVTIAADIRSTSMLTVENEITATVQTKLGNMDLPGPYHHVAYVVEGCYKDCIYSLAAYAMTGGWLSVFFGDNSRFAAVQLHEFGHNFGLGHSGGIDSEEYSDYTCLMGNPLVGFDDIGKMCFNPAKNWQLDWYRGSQLELSARLGDFDIPSQYTLVGVTDFLNNPRNHPVVIKVSSYQDVFVGFNRASGITSENVQADNEVTIVQGGSTASFLGGGDPGQTYLKSTLKEGETYVIGRFATSTTALVIRADEITVGANPSTAKVSFELIDYVDTVDTFVVMGGLQDCGWVSSLKEYRCSLSTADGKSIGSLCPVTCDGIAAPPSYPGPSPRPTPHPAPRFPSTIKPTVSPTLRPTDNPTTSPSQTPTGSPSVSSPPSESAAPSVSPTHECFDFTGIFFINDRERDCDWVAHRSSRCFGQTDDGRDTAAMRSKSCSFPCPEPSEAPTSYPTTTVAPTITAAPSSSSAPTRAPTAFCVDTKDSFVFKDRERDCTWVLNRLNRCQETTGDGIAVQTLCPESCEYDCPVPTSSPSFIPSDQPSMIPSDQPSTPSIVPTSEDTSNSTDISSSPTSALLT